MRSEDNIKLTESEMIERLLKQGVSWSEIVKRAGLNVNTLKAWYNKKVVPQATKPKKLRDFYELKMNEIETESKNPVGDMIKNLTDLGLSKVFISQQTGYHIQNILVWCESKKPRSKEPLEKLTKLFNEQKEIFPIKRERERIQKEKLYLEIKEILFVLITELKIALSQISNACDVPYHTLYKWHKETTPPPTITEKMFLKLKKYYEKILLIKDNINKYDVVTLKEKSKYTKENFMELIIKMTDSGLNFSDIAKKSNIPIGTLASARSKGRISHSNFEKLLSFYKVFCKIKDINY